MFLPKIPQHHMPSCAHPAGNGLSDGACSNQYHNVFFLIAHNLCLQRFK